MGRTLTYPISALNKLNRKRDRGSYDLETIHSIVKQTPVCHVSFTPDPADPFPAILPMIGVMGSFDFPSASLDEPMDCYLHGYISSRIMNLARSSEQGLAVCVAATKVDGIVLSLTPNSHSYNYRSVILYGYGTLVDSVEEKLYAMQLITNSVIQDRWAHARTPPDGAEMQSTVILKVKIVSGSGKIRDGGPNDEVKDTSRDDVTGNVWTGVVPFWETYGDPVPGPLNRVKEVPKHITDCTAEGNQRNEDYGKSACTS